MRLIILIILSFISASLSQDCPLMACSMYCQHGFEQDENGCSICSCKPPPHKVYSGMCDGVECSEGLVCKSFSLTSSRHHVSRCVDPHTPDRCQQPMDIGPCKKSVEKWFYNTDSQQCEKFYYGGCRGNDNIYDAEINCRLMCVPEVEPRERHECPVLECTPCSSGYKHDQNECYTCECNNPEVDCPEIGCHMACEHGFQKDSRGCNMCSCLPVPEPYADPCDGKDLCMLYCQHGMKRDADGCTMCECRESAPCADLQCALQCDYGFAKAWDGCPMCQCASNPCNAVDCGKDKFCKPVLEGTTLWQPTCHDLHVERPWCDDNAMCSMYCPHGYNTDQYGCKTCSCLDQPLDCPVQECPPTCPYGVMYDHMGCRTCECLPDPCQDYNCRDLGYDVCEAVYKYDNCATCPAEANCLLARNVRQVKIELEYAHDPVDEHINFKGLHVALREHIIEVMSVENDDVKSFKVEELHDKAVQVEYYVITFGDEDLVQITEEFITDIENQELHILFMDTRFVPQQHTVQHRYYSSHSYPDDVYNYDEEEESDSTQQIIIIVAVVIAAVVGVLVIVLVICVMTRGKAKQKGGQNSKLIYKKVPQGKEAHGQQVKKHPPVDEIATA